MNTDVPSLFISSTVMTHVDIHERSSDFSLYLCLKTAIKDVITISFEISFLKYF